ncbi:MAG: flippase-like domain-containing protein [Bacteroidetes bacterium]|nr:flippase-like domain-containing protein [Bacteroidota bacterium]
MNSTFSFLLKALIAALLVWLIAHRLFVQNDFEAQWQLFTQNLSAAQVVWIVVAILLMPVNWYLETIKWQKLLQDNIAFAPALRSVLSGVTLGFVSPARLGEFSGRIWHLSPEMRRSAFYLSNLGGIAQTAITLVAGAVCFSLWVNNPFVSGIVIGLSVVFLLLFFRFDVVNNYLSKKDGLRKAGFYISDEELPDLRTQSIVISFSLVRYLVYLFQYVCAFHFFGIEATVFTLTIHSGVLLLMNSFSPLLPALDFSFRGTVALYVFREISDNSLALLSAATFIWLLNLVLPALVGYLFIVRKEKQS